MDYRNPRGPVGAALVQLRTTSVPLDLALSTEINALCDEKIASPYGFQAEHKVLEQHEALKRKPSFMTMLEESGLTSPTDSDGFITATIAPLKEVPPPRPVPLTTQNSFNGSEFAGKQRKIQEMTKATGEGEEICGFFLESMDWNLDEALTMYYSTKS